MPKPDVDYIGGLSPSISISRRRPAATRARPSARSPRSTTTCACSTPASARGIARSASGRSPPRRASRSSPASQQLPAGTKFSVLAPVIRRQKGEYKDLFEDLLKQGFVRARVDGQVVQLTDDLTLDRQMRHDIEVVIDRLVMKGDVRAAAGRSGRAGAAAGEGESDRRDGIDGVRCRPLRRDERDGDEERRRGRGKRAKRSAGPRGRHSSSPRPTPARTAACRFEPPSPQLFSFNSPQGMCPDCDGLGVQYYVRSRPARPRSQGCRSRRAASS